ncbi:hypothetical protein F8M49_01070 [Rhodococcus zopfii]|uniref:Uncharacterized protein n=1 Tax=Rhodococcus zopfii TaxID=43772 RepID=A0ABU3WK26_9NOCA|nr:hypothetical protein [Rhodococcus zopfii]
MWQESPAGIAELLHTDLLTSDLAPVDAKPALWARKGITLSADRLDRDALFRSAARARADGSDDAMLGLFWDVLAWGVMGNFRNTGRIIAFAGTEDGRTRLLCAVRTAAAASYEGRIEDAYRAFVEHRVPQLGWAFFHQDPVLHRQPDLPGSGVSDLRFPGRVRSSDGHRPLRHPRPQTGADLRAYCRDLHDWGRRLRGVPGGDRGAPVPTRPGHRQQPTRLAQRRGLVLPARTQHR